MLSEQQFQQFQANGFLNGGKVLDDATVQELSDELDRILDIGPDGFGENDPQPVMFRDLTGGTKDQPVWQIVNAWEASPAFKRLVHHEWICEAIAQICNVTELMIWHDQVQYKPARVGGTTYWHQDAPLWPIVKPMTEVSAWIPFDDADEENGCMWMVPGSHQWGNCHDYLKRQDGQQTPFFELGRDFTPPEDAAEQQVKMVPTPVKRGEVHFHHALTWHGSPNNTSDRPRRALAIHYMTGDAVFVASGQHPMKQFVDLPDGGPMREAGEHFPHVWREGQHVAASA